MGEKGKSFVSKVALSAGEIQEVYGIPAGTLANLRCRRAGAPFFRVGKSVYYRVTDFESWFFSEPVLTKQAVRR